MILSIIRYLWNVYFSLASTGAAANGFNFFLSFLVQSMDLLNIQDNLLKIQDNLLK